MVDIYAKCPETLDGLHVGPRRGIPTLKKVYRLYRDIFPYPEAARLFDLQLSDGERRRVKGHIRFREVVDGYAKALTAEAMRITYDRVSIFGNVANNCSGLQCVAVPDIRIREVGLNHQQ